MSAHVTNVDCDETSSMKLAQRIMQDTATRLEPGADGERQALYDAALHELSTFCEFIDAWNDDPNFNDQDSERLEHASYFLDRVDSELSVCRRRVEQALTSKR